LHPGPSRATVGPGKTLSRGRSGEKIFLFKMVHYVVFYISEWQQGPQMLQGLGELTLLPHPLDRPDTICPIPKGFRLQQKIRPSNWSGLVFPVQSVTLSFDIW